MYSTLHATACYCTAYTPHTTNPTCSPLAHLPALLGHMPALPPRATTTYHLPPACCGLCTRYHPHYTLPSLLPHASCRLTWEDCLWVASVCMPCLASHMRYTCALPHTYLPTPSPFCFPHPTACTGLRIYIPPFCHCLYAFSSLYPAYATCSHLLPYASSLPPSPTQPPARSRTFLMPALPTSLSASFSAWMPAHLLLLHIIWHSPNTSLLGS